MNIASDRELLRACIAQARLAPSVHNIQPTRWRPAPDGIALLEDTARRLPVADPTRRDVMISHGIALEGLDIALRARGLSVTDTHTLPLTEPDAHGLVEIAYANIAPTHEMMDAPGRVEARVSWRGTFANADASTSTNLDLLTQACSDLTLVRNFADIVRIAGLGDVAGLHFLRDPRHRAELISWMRLSKSDPRYFRDGLTREAMCLGALEAWGAGLVLGPLFQTLDNIGLANPLVSEFAKTRTAAAIALIHRPMGEDLLATGRAFYRAWLAIENAGFNACPMSVLVDQEASRDELCRRHPLPQGRTLVNVFRIGRPTRSPNLVRARLPLDELIIED